MLRYMSIMKNFITLIIVSLTILSCNGLSKEELKIHNQKVSLGIQKKKSDLSGMLSRIGKQSEELEKKLKKVSSFRLGRSKAKKQQQIAEVKQEIKALAAYKNRVIQLRKELDTKHEAYDFQDDPQEVVENIFISAKNNDFKTLLWLADPYDENDRDVDGLSYTQTLSPSQKKVFVNTFKKGKVVGEPIIDSTTAKVNFLYGYKGNIKKTMNLVKRNQNWYLASF